jgi:hypothetical protein
MARHLDQFLDTHGGLHPSTREQTVKRPDFIIIGAMKSATSSLHVQLASQDGIFMSEPKEPNFFSDDDEYRQGTNRYLDLFAGAGEGDLCGESSTHYTKLPDYPETIPRMKALLPNVRLIYVMRHPIDRLVSHYIHQWTQNVIRCDINGALDAYPELINYGRYSYQLEPYFAAFGQSAVLPVFFEAVKQHPQRELTRIARFIGYQGQVTWKEDLGAQNVSTERLRRFRGYQLIVDSPPMAFVRRTFVPQSIRDMVKARLSMKQRPTLDESNVARLESIFDEDLRTLSKWIDLDLNCQNFDEMTSKDQLEWSAS